MEQRRVTPGDSIADAFGPSSTSTVSEEADRGRCGPAGPQARGPARDSVADTERDWLGEEIRLPRRERIWREREARRAEVGADDPSPSWAAACHLWDRVMADVRHMPAEYEAEGWDLATEMLIAFRLNLSRRFGLDLDIDLRSGR